MTLKEELQQLRNRILHLDQQQQEISQQYQEKQKECLVYEKRLARYNNRQQKFFNKKRERRICLLQIEAITLFGIIVLNAFYGTFPKSFHPLEIFFFITFSITPSLLLTPLVFHPSALMSWKGDELNSKIETASQTLNKIKGDTEILQEALDKIFTERISIRQQFNTLMENAVSPVSYETWYENCLTELKETTKVYQLQKGR